MSNSDQIVFALPEAYVSPYLMRPIRTYEQAKADIAARKKRADVVKPFIHMLPTQNNVKQKSTLAA